MIEPQTIIAPLLRQLDTVIVGKSGVICDAVTCLLTGGHLLIEGLPGAGKTTLAHALAHSFGLRFSRVQFTSVLMPSDFLSSPPKTRTTSSARTRCPSRNWTAF